ncbi:Alkaline_phosphatase [Hexamita inflata]|uniref:Alkaline_phosphatase n=1 Tax=Hexamita inflata TaxID=28002 RepID=A0ABP1HWY6_9EUKA
MLVVKHSSDSLNQQQQIQAQAIALKVKKRESPLLCPPLYRKYTRTEVELQQGKITYVVRDLDTGAVLNTYEQDTQ